VRAFSSACCCAETIVVTVITCSAFAVAAQHDNAQTINIANLM
jgi:hypothetical protein